MPFRLRPIACILLSLALAADVLAAGGTLTGVVLAERGDRKGHTQLLLAVPSQVDGRPVNEVRLELPGNLAQKLDVQRLPAGWTVKKGPVLSGPALTTPVIAAAFGAHGLTLPKTIEIEVRGGGTRLFAGTVPLGRLPAVKTAASTDNFVRLPQLIAAGEPVTFEPLWQEAGGQWQIDGKTPQWNGDLGDSKYTFTLSAGTKLPLGIRYTDPWGETLLDGVADDVHLGAPAKPGSPPTLMGCSPKVLVGSPVCVCGHFPNEAARNAITVNGKPLGGDLLVSASSFVLNFRLPPDLKPGPFTIAGSPEAGYPASAQADGLLIAVGGELDRNRLWKGESTPLRLWLEGTAEPIELRLWNSTPGIISLGGGEDQTVVTSGGQPNQVVRTVFGHTPGDFSLTYKLTLGSCPCAEKGAGPPVMVAEGPPAIATQTRARTPCDDCAELRRRAEEARQKARLQRHTADRAAENRDWYEQEARGLTEQLAKDQAYLDTIRRQAREWRELVASARASAEKNRERDRRQPGRGWADEVERDLAEAKRRVEDAERLEHEARELEQRMARKKSQPDELRRITDLAEAAAKEAGRLAAEAQAAYEACLARRPANCPPVSVAAGPTVATTTGGETVRDDSAGDDKKKPTPNYCGPDVTKAYLAAMQRVYRRMQQVPDSEKGSWDGAMFLGTNGWAIDQWPKVSEPAVGQADCPSGMCRYRGNSVGQNCYTLFGHCVPGHVLNDIMYGFTADLVHVPKPIQELGAHWAEASFNTPEGKAGKYPADLLGYLRGALTFADPEISQASYLIGDELAEEWDSDTPMGGTEIAAEIADDWEGFLSELTKAYPWLAQCQACPTSAEFIGWTRDWSRATWTLSDGTKLSPPPR